MLTLMLSVCCDLLPLSLLLALSLARPFSPVLSLSLFVAVCARLRECSCLFLCTIPLWFPRLPFPSPPLSFYFVQMFSANKQQTTKLWMWRMEYLHHEQRPLYFGEWF